MSRARDEARLKVSSLPRDYKYWDRGKGGDSGEEVEAVVKWNDRRTSMGPATSKGSGKQLGVARVQDAG